jgi:hypothetical protein
VTSDWRSELLDAYRRHRIDDQSRYYGRRGVEFERARRWTLATSAGLLVSAALCGALGAAYGEHRAMWAFIAAALSAVASALNGFETAFGFERFSRAATETRPHRYRRHAGPRSAAGDRRSLMAFVVGSNVCCAVGRHVVAGRREATGTTTSGNNLSKPLKKSLFELFAARR